MRSFALFTTIALSLAAFPFVAADHDGSTDHAEPSGSNDPVGLSELVGVDTNQTDVQALLARIAALEALLAEALGGGSSGDEVGEPCTTTVGCLKLPLYVDEDGDEMTGELHMLNRGIKFFPGGSPTDAFDLGHTSFLNNTRFDIRAPTNFTSEVKLEPNARLNTTGGAEVFIDYFGNLTFADGSFINPEEATFGQSVTFTENVKVFKNITIVEGGSIVFQNNTGILTSGSLSRIGTTTNNPFFIISNNTTAVAIWPAPSQDGAANIVMGHPGNNVTSAADLANFIGGGGSVNFPNLVEGGFSFVMGGEDNQIAGNHSAVGGQGARAAHDNTFVWNDGGSVITSSAPNTFLVNATGGVGIGTTSPTSALTVNGDITPATNGSRALGAPNARWHQLYLASEIDFVNELLYTSGGSTIMTLNDDGSVVIPGSINVGTIVGDASGLTGITAASIADGSISQAKLASDSVGSAQLIAGSIDPSHFADSCTAGEAFVSNGVSWECGTIATSDEDTLGALGCAEAEIARFTAGVWVCSIDIDTDTDTDTLASLGCSLAEIARMGEGAWYCSTDVDTNTDTLGDLVCVVDQIPVYDDLSESWVCGNNTDTTYGAGFGLSLTGTTFDVDSSVMQRRVTATCPAGSSIRAIAQDGTVICETDDDTVYVAGQGIEIIGSEIGIIDSVTQRRVTGNCAPGSAIRSIAQDGTVTCDVASSDAQTLDGFDSSQFLRKDVSQTFTGTNLRHEGAGAFVTYNNIYLGDGNATDSDFLFFDAGAESLDWQDALSTFSLSDGLHMEGPLVVNPTILSGNFNRFGNASPGVYMDSIGDLLVSDDLEVRGMLSLNSLIDGDVVPNFDGDYNLGSDNHHFRELYLSNDVFYPYGSLSIISEATGKEVEFDSAGNIILGGNTIGMGWNEGEGNRQIYFREDGSNFGEQFGWDDTNDRFDLTDDVWIRDSLQTGGHIATGVAPNFAHKILAVENDSLAGFTGVAGKSSDGPTNGYLGVQGDVNFDGVPSADWLGDDIGVAGISTGFNDFQENFGVVGHSNNVGVRGEFSGSPNNNYAELGLDGIGLRARGGTLAAQFLHDISVQGMSGTDNDDIFFDDGVTEFLQWNDGLQRFRFTDELEVDGLVMSGSTLAKSGGQLRWDGDNVCLESGNCGGSALRVVAPNDVKLASGLVAGSDAPGMIAGDIAVKTLESLGSSSFCRVGTTLYWNMNQDSCAGGSVGLNDLRLTAGGGQAAFSYVSGAHADFGNAFAADAGLVDGGSELDFVDQDGNGIFNVGDDLIADTDGNSVVSVGDFIIGGANAGTYVTAPHPMVGLPLADGVANQGSFALDTAGAFWDLMPNGAWNPGQDVPYIDISMG